MLPAKGTAAPVWTALEGVAVALVEEAETTTLLEGVREGVADGETAGVEAGLLEAMTVCACTIVCVIVWVVMIVEVVSALTNEEIAKKRPAAVIANFMVMIVFAFSSYLFKCDKRVCAETRYRVKMLYVQRTLWRQVKIDLRGARR